MKLTNKQMHEIETYCWNNYCPVETFLENLEYELGNEKIFRIVIYLLGSAYLHNNALPHYHDDIGNAHSLLLVVSNENGGNARALLYPSYLLSCLKP